MRLPVAALACCGAAALLHPRLTAACASDWSEQVLPYLRREGEAIQRPWLWALLPAAHPLLPPA
jgi:hypothetical protein